jgi:threonine-phosphate decarboxylase
MTVAAACASRIHSHGGDVERAARESGIPVDRILDFSANVNPLGLPLRAAERLARDAQDPRLLMQYPDADSHGLLRVLSERLSVPPQSVVIGAGADSLIHAAVRALEPRRCIIPVPAFLEYGRACRAYGCAIRTIPLAAREQLDPGDLVIFNNPHNPTGACASRAEMLNRIATARARGATVLAHEAFVDYVPGASITREAATQPGVIAVRSLTKFFGCPGLRVGYAVAAPETVSALRAQLPAWPVTTLALNALSEAVGDVAYICDTLKTNERARELLTSALGGLGCYVFPSAANFLFLRLPSTFNAGCIRERMLRDHAILVRECDSFESLEPGRYLRVAVRGETENARLIEALGSLFDKGSCQR